MRIRAETRFEAKAGKELEVVDGARKETRYPKWKKRKSSRLKRKRLEDQSWSEA